MKNLKKISTGRNEYLLDTNLLLWMSLEPERISSSTTDLISNYSHDLFFSVVSIWEVAIKFAKHPKTFTANPYALRTGLLEREFQELPLQSSHAIATLRLPLLHRDPFDRILLAQALVEQIVLLTVDERLAAYDAPVQLAG